MSGTPFATPSNNAFAGGARFALSNPVAGSGTLAPASTGVPNPAAGVQGANVSYARNNSGSNIRIPYARICPLSDPSTALPVNSKSPAMQAYQTLVNNGGHSTTHMVLESEALHAGRIAFIRGQRSDPMPQESAIGAGDGMNVSLHGMNMTSANGQQLLAVNRQMGHGVDRLQRLCSIEYLQRYFAFVLRRVKLSLNTRFDDATMGGNGTLDNYTRGILREYKAAVITLSGATAAGATLSEAGDVAKQAAGAAGVAWATEKCGVFARDIHPFLRGKCGKKGLVEIQASTGKTPSARASRALGDQYAFAALDLRLAKLGLHDWRPDGIVLSKDHAGPDEAVWCPTRTSHHNQSVSD